MSRAPHVDDHGQRDARHVDTAIEGLVELPTYRPAPVYEVATRRKPVPVRAKRATLLDRLVAAAGVDHVTIDLAALERDIDSLRAE